MDDTASVRESSEPGGHGRKNYVGMMATSVHCRMQSHLAGQRDKSRSNPLHRHVEGSPPGPIEKWLVLRKEAGGPLKAGQGSERATGDLGTGGEETENRSDKTAEARASSLEGKEEGRAQDIEKKLIDRNTIKERQIRETTTRKSKVP